MALIITIYHSFCDGLPKGLQSPGCYAIPILIYDILADYDSNVIELNYGPETEAVYCDLRPLFLVEWTITPRKG